MFCPSIFQLYHMAPRPRLHGFQGTDQEYISYLEGVILSTVRSRPPSPPTLSSHGGDDGELYTPRSPVGLASNAGALSSEGVRGTSTGSASRKMTLAQKPANKNNQLTFVYDKHSFGPPVTKRARSQEPRWRKYADDMLQEIATVDTWSSADNDRAITIILGTLRESGSSDVSNPVVKPMPLTGLLDCATRYAKQNRASHTEMNFSRKLLSFQDLVFVSLCVVLIHCGVDQGKVDDVMRICISASSAKHLCRLRSGAVWANRLINHLFRQGWGHHATDVFVFGRLIIRSLCGNSIANSHAPGGRPVAHYGRFSDHSDQSTHYFLTRLRDQRNKIFPSDSSKGIAFSVPFFVGKLLGFQST